MEKYKYDKELLEYLEYLDKECQLTSITSTKEWLVTRQKVKDELQEYIHKTINKNLNH